jgi:DNA-directed RNA polymerase beta subunit
MIYSSILRKAVLFPGLLQVHRQVMMRSLASQMIETAGSEPSILVAEGTDHIPDVPGTYLNVAFMLFAGWNLEDAAVISRSAASKLSCTAVVKETVESTAAIEVLCQRGDTVVKGSILCRSAEKLFRASITVPGIITSVSTEKSLSGTTPVETCVVTINCDYKCSVGSKVSNMHSSKSIVSRVMPDDRMPHCNGVPADIIISPYAIGRRMAPSTIMEIMLNTLVFHRRKTEPDYSMIVKPFDQDLKFDKVAAELAARGYPSDCMYNLSNGKNGQLFANKTLFGPMRIGRLWHHAPDKLRKTNKMVPNHEGIAMRGKGGVRYGREEIEVFYECGATGMVKEMKACQDDVVISRIHDLMDCAGYSFGEEK